ncbi:hypothetical protein KTO58_21490 [Chitinophaga pendula]|uniref:hypothetical protein n=1 Tax=Chitinophaga TaxID=79328 RepID=UPI000BB039E8|nr:MULTISPECIES: hypothetical protein [Chitinophaga]ASZ10798.1 hypothetical protein CK934_07310 [Chitinophaga sp. MD30]UCJ06223.1 hypothetical protein KTO58_21490 [Chitinophaga pendula]
MRRFVFLVVSILILVAAAFAFYKYYFVFGKGVKAGELNYFVEKGYVFKTYEGRLIQSGYRSKQPGAIQSNEFMFSVKDERVAQQLMKASGKSVELHYKEYLGALPWRGFSNFIVDSVLTVSEPTQ